MIFNSNEQEMNEAVFILHNWLKQNNMAMKKFGLPPITEANWVEASFKLRNKGERPIFKAKSMASCLAKNFSDCSGRPNIKSLFLWLIAFGFGHSLASYTL